jgi:hypothetical protein
MNNKKIKWFAIACLLTGMSVLASCVSSSGNFGRLKYDGAVKQSFESFIVNPEYTYYHFGPKAFPRAVVGISKGFTMDSRFWTAIDLTSKNLRSWIWGHAQRNGDFKHYGSRIIDRQGRHIGVWYSLEGWQQWARIEIIDETVVNIGAPIDPQQFRRFEPIMKD